MTDDKAQTEDIIQPSPASAPRVEDLPTAEEQENQIKGGSRNGNLQITQFYL
jgi:hypothetical protein